MPLFLSFLLSFILIGCGYTTGSLLPSEYKKISIEPFKNNITFVSETNRGLYIPLLENKVRAAIADRFLFDGNLKIANSDRADLILKGELLSFERDELRLTDNQDVQEYRVRVTVSFTIIDTATNEPFITEPSFSGEATYFVSGPKATSESTAVDEALVDLARRVVERTIENW